MQALSRRLKDVGRGDLRRQMRREIKEAGRPVIADLRTAVMGVDVKSTRGGVARPNRSTGLRRRIARHTGLSVTQSGIRIRVRSRRVDPRYPKLVKYLIAPELGNFARWRHPVFGNQNNWVQQRGESTFFPTINRHRTRFRRAAFEAMRKTADKITD